jgi:hypothetical protein
LHHHHSAGRAKILLRLPPYSKKRDIIEFRKATRRITWIGSKNEH